VGGTYARTAEQTPSFKTGKRFTFNTASFSFGNAATDEVLTMTVAIDNMIEAKHSFNNSFYPSRIKRTGSRVVNINGTVRYDSVTNKNNYLGFTQDSFEMAFTGTTEIQSGYYDQLVIHAPSLLLLEHGDVAGGPGEIEASVSGKAKYHVGSGTALTVTLVNTRAAY